MGGRGGIIKQCHTPAAHRQPGSIENPPRCVCVCLCVIQEMWRPFNYFRINKRSAKRVKLMTVGNLELEPAIGVFGG